jgi:hypothetical protein
MSKRTSKGSAMLKVQKLSAGMRQYLSGQVLTLAGKPVKVADLLTEFDGYIAQLTATDVARGAWLAQVDATTVMEDSAVNTHVSLLESYLRTYYGPTSQTLIAYGLTPRKARDRTGAEMVETAAKSAATRVARHTLGPKQKASIHGVVAPPASEPSSPQQPTASPNADAPKRSS